MNAATCWADPLTKAERRVLARKLARACSLFYAAACPCGRMGAHQSMALTLASADMSDLHLDVTERAS